MKDLFFWILESFATHYVIVNFWFCETFKINEEILENLNKKWVSYKNTISNWRWLYSDTGSYTVK